MRGACRVLLVLLYVRDDIEDGKRVPILRADHVVAKRGERKRAAVERQLLVRVSRVPVHSRTTRSSARAAGHHTSDAHQ